MLQSDLAKKARFHYRLAWGLLLFLLFIAVFGGSIMPHGIEEADKQTVISQKIDGRWQMVSAPFAPNAAHWLGTDHRGFDVLSLLLHGAAYTIGLALLITVARFALAVPMGLYSGTTGRGRGWLSSLQLATTAVPPLLFIFPMMFGLSKVMNPEQTSGPLFVMLVLLGIFPLANQFAERGAHFNDKLYVTAARAMGASDARIAFGHLMPHLRPEMMFAFLTEMVQVLFLFGQLAVIRVFIGGGEVFQLADGTVHSAAEIMFLTKSGEWGAMITYGIHVIRSYPWIVLSAGGFLVGAILILSFFAKQLQARTARPYLYNNKPLPQDKPRLALIGGLAAACLALLIVTTGQQDMPKPQTATKTASAAIEQRYQGLEVMRTADSSTARKPKKTANSSSSDTKPTASEANNQADETKRQNLVKSKSWLFARALESGDWQSASPYIYAPDQKPGDPIPPAPVFEEWMQKLTREHYKLLDIGDIQPMPSPDDAKQNIYRYSAELKLTAPDGQPQSWHLEVIARHFNKTVIDVVTGHTGGK